MANHPNRTLASERRSIERLIVAAERYGRVREINAGKAARNGLIGQTDIAKEQAAQDAWEAAKTAALAKFQ
jgi:hypothetical protein